MSHLAEIFQEMGFHTKSVRLPEAGVIYALARTFSLVNRQLAAVYQRFGLSAASFNLLMLLKHGRDPDGCTQQAIGSRLVVSPSDMTGLLDRLERRELVKRLPGKDRRSKLLRITPKGSALLDDVWPHHVEAIQRLTRIFKPAEGKVLLAALSRMRQVSAA